MNNLSQFYNNKEYRFNQRYNIWISEDGVIVDNNFQPITLYEFTSNLGHKYLGFWFHGKVTYAHRVIAFCWCPGYEKGLVVDHIDGDRFNNNPSNLQWITQSENVKKGLSKNRRKLKKKGANAPGERKNEQ